MNYAQEFQKHLMHSAFDFMETEQLLLMQQANKFCYKSAVPSYKKAWPFKQCNFIVANNQKQFYLVSKRKSTLKCEKLLEITE